MNQNSILTIRGEKKMKVVYFLVAILALASSLVSAHDPSPLQDFCVATKERDGVFVNGKFCKDPKLVKAEDFFRHVEPGNTSNPNGAQVTQVFVDQLPALNTLGISLARVDFAPKGLNPPHTHPRGTEILIVTEGTLYVGFVTSNQDGNRLFTKVLNKGDVFVFPIGLIHFQRNVGYGNAVAIAALSSQNPGTITIANVLFKANPPISSEVLTKAFQVDKKRVLIGWQVRQHSMIAFPKMVLEELGAAKIESGTKLYLFNLDHGVADDDIKIGRSKGTTEVVFVRHSNALAAIKKYNNMSDGKLLQIEFVGTYACSATPVVTPLCQTNLMGRPNDVVYLLVALLALTSTVVSAYDPSPLQDFCVAAKEKDGVFVNGKFCKDPKLVKAEDFFRHVEPGKTDNPLGSNVTQVFVDQLPGLNTLGIGLARIDFAPKGLNAPHTHPRGTEILIVLEGTLYVGFVTSNQDGNRLFTKVLNKGDVFVFPIGLIHFQLNVGYGNAVAIAGLSSQNPGAITIANALFKANPPISSEVLTKAFQVDKSIIDYLQKQSWYDNNN
ncbi:Germin-like protein subfamily 1 member 7 [Glycine max]|nr:Germin-like protein subfamily 1 member 7 [Glycine max]